MGGNFILSENELREMDRGEFEQFRRDSERFVRLYKFIFPVAIVMSLAATVAFFADGQNENGFKFLAIIVPLLVLMFLVGRFVVRRKARLEQISVDRADGEHENPPRLSLAQRFLGYRLNPKRAMFLIALNLALFAVLLSNVLRGYSAVQSHPEAEGVLKMYVLIGFNALGVVATLSCVGIGIYWLIKYLREAK